MATSASAAAAIIFFFSLGLFGSKNFILKTYGAVLVVSARRKYVARSIRRLTRVPLPPAVGRGPAAPRGATGATGELNDWSSATRDWVTLSSSTALIIRNCR